MTDRIAGTLLTGLDAAVEFATLGEYRLVETTPAVFDHERELVAAPLARRLTRTSGPPRSERTGAQHAASLQPCRAGGASPRPVRSLRREPRRTRGGAVQPVGQLCPFTR